MTKQIDINQLQNTRAKITIFFQFKNNYYRKCVLFQRIAVFIEIRVYFFSNKILEKECLDLAD